MDNNQFVQGKPSYSLTGNGVSSSDTSVTVSDFTLPDGTNITMSMFGDTGYGTFEPGTAREENVSFTGVTQNANGTATLTGVTRGLRFVAPYTADSGLAKGHGGNTPFVLSNSAPFYNELSGKDNDETITGTWTFTSPNYPRIDDADNVATLDPQFVTKKMLDDTAFTGANLNKVVVAGVAGETVAENDILYFDETDEEWKKASATFVNQESYLIGLAMGAGTDGNGIDGGVMLEGVKGSFTGLSAGEPIFLSDTAGEISTSAGTIQVELGYVQTASTTEILFFPKFKSYLLADTKDALNNPTSGGTLSSSNPVVDSDDTATTSTANAVVRGDSVGVIDNSWIGFGDGSDGALTTSGNASIDASSANIVEKNYTSVTINSGDTVDITNPANDGTLVIWYVQGDVVINGTLDLTGTGTLGGDAVIANPDTGPSTEAGNAGTLLNNSILFPANQNTSENGKAGNGFQGSEGEATGGSGGGSLNAAAKVADTDGLTGPNGGESIYDLVHNNFENALKINRTLFNLVGVGGGSGGAACNASGRTVTSGFGGRGGGGLIIYAGGNITVSASGTIDVSGADGGDASETGNNSNTKAGGGGGGGSAGSVFLLSRADITNSGTINVSGGTGGLGIADTGTGDNEGTDGTDGSDGISVLISNVTF